MQQLASGWHIDPLNPGQPTQNDGFGSEPELILPDRPLLPRWLYAVAVTLLVMGWFWAGQTLGLIRSPQESNARYIYADVQGRQMINEIALAARNNEAYNAGDAARDVHLMMEINAKTRWDGVSNPLTGSENAVGLVRQRAAQNYLRDQAVPQFVTATGHQPNEGQLRSMEFEALGSIASLYDQTYHTQDFGDVRKGLRSTFAFGALMIPFALLILVLRALVAVETLPQAVVIWRATWAELLGGALVWPLGFLLYKPGVSVVYDAISRLAQERGSHLYGFNPVLSPDRPSGCPIWDSTAQEVLSWRLPKLELLRVVWRPIPRLTGQPLLNWSRGFIYQLAYAGYASVVLALVLAAGTGKAWAESLTLSVADPLEGGIATANIGYGHGPYGLWMFGLGGPDPTVEVAYSPWAAQVGDLSFSYGPFADYGLNSGRLKSVGVSGFATMPLLDGHLSGPYYVSLDTTDQGRPYAILPNHRLLWRVSDQTQLGIAGKLVWGWDKEAIFQIGPCLQQQLDDELALRFRVIDDPRRWGTNPAAQVELLATF